MAIGTQQRLIRICALVADCAFAIMAATVYFSMQANEAPRVKDAAERVPNDRTAEPCRNTVDATASLVALMRCRNAP